MSIKGSWRRPRSITREEEDLRIDYMNGEISLATFNKKYAVLLHQGKIQRSGRVLKP